LSTKPLIPAKAGTQIIRLDALRWSKLLFTRRFFIWIPAFAGMSGGE
jgi:hypothetical protein